MKKTGHMNETPYGDRKRERVIHGWTWHARTVLDFGCGTGDLTHYLRDRGREVVGYDIDPGVLPEERMFTSELPDRRFDVVIASEVLEHSPQPTRMLEELSRMAVRLVIVTVPNGYGPYEILMRVQSFFHSLGLGTPKFEKYPHVQFFTKRRLRELFRLANLEIIEERNRTFLCGPYVDLLPLPWRLNAWIADFLPSWLCSDWMFLLRKTT